MHKAKQKLKWKIPNNFDSDGTKLGNWYNGEKLIGGDNLFAITCSRKKSFEKLSD
jgi:hypothetical protein